VIGLLRELDSTDIGALLGTRWGSAWIAEVVGLCVAGAVSALLFRSSSRNAPDPAPRWGYGVAIPLAAAAAGISWAGHASSGTDAGIGIGIDAIHLWATGIWLGGVAALLAIVPPARRGLSDADATRFGAAVVVRFSTVAILCVGTLVVTGVYRAIAELTAFNDLVDTGYGRALLVKLGVFALLLIGGAVNRLVLHPRLERAALGLRQTDGGAGQALRISLAAEIAVAVVLLAVVGVLVNIPPP
jgi:copper transport protein